MSVLDSDANTLAIIIEDAGFDEGQVAAAAFLARYTGARSMPIATTRGHFWPAFCWHISRNPRPIPNNVEVSWPWMGGSPSRTFFDGGVRVRWGSWRNKSIGSRSRGRSASTAPPAALLGVLDEEHLVAVRVIEVGHRRGWRGHANGIVELDTALGQGGHSCV
jgi:hypothetical protein